LETAVQQAVSGDTIYLPGVEIQLTNDLVIDKKLALIGIGWDVDSIGGLHRTELKSIASGGSDYANISFREGSNGSLLIGCILENIIFGYKDEINDLFQNIENITILRNYIRGAIKLGVDQQNNNVKKIFIKENVINGGINGFYATECWISNNLLGYCIYGNSSSWSANILYLKDSHIYNNVCQTHNYSMSALYFIQECIFENNYFTVQFNEEGAWNSSFVTNCIFSNNAFVGNITFPLNTNIGSNNLVNQETIKTFQVNDLTLPKNLTIRDTSPCKNAGTDGTDIGIYGGSTPYKAGAVPFNPHINQAVISSQTDKDGKLPVNIVVTAQDR
jgi:hypothetical protein